MNINIFLDYHRIYYSDFLIFFLTGILLIYNNHCKQKVNIYFVLKIKIMYSRYNNSSNYVIVFEFKYILSVELERIWGFLSGEFFTRAWQRGRSVHVYWTPCASIAYLPATEKKEKEEEDRRKKRISWPKMLISFIHSHCWSQTVMGLNRFIATTKITYCSNIEILNHYNFLIF